MNTITKGKRGEDIALQYLQEQGMKLIARNWRSSHKELDIVVDNGEFLRVVEVKSLYYPNDQEPANAVDYHKQKLIISATRQFITKHEIQKEVVFDIISIVFNGEHHQLNYIPNAFTPNW